MEYFQRSMRERKPGENLKWNRNGGGEKDGLQRVDSRSDKVSCGIWAGVRRMAQTAKSLCTAWLPLQIEAFEDRHN